MSSSQSRGSLGKGSWGSNLPGSRKAGQVFPLGFQTVGRGCLCWGGTSLPCSVPALLRMDSSCRTISTGEPICISRAKRLRGEEPLSSPSWVPADWRGWGASDRTPALTRWGGSCCATPWRRRCCCARLARSQTPLSLPSPLPAAECPGQTGGGTARGQPCLTVTPAPRCHPHVSPPCRQPHSAHFHFPHPTLVSPTRPRPPHPIGPSGWFLT